MSTPDGGALTEALARGTSRRGFLARAGKALLIVAGGSALAAAEAEDAAAFHFCGHTYTTASCPHPTGIPRVDARNFPLRARDGHPVADLGRLIDRHGRPVDEHGNLLRDLDGRPLPKASRTPVCRATGETYGFAAQLDGAWYRCCGGHVRKLVDCCGYVTDRINGDAALTGYCFGGRKVFCVMFTQTRVPC